MAGTRKLSIEVVGDTRGVSKAFNDVDNDAGKMSSGVAGKIGKAGVALAGFALVGGAAAIGIGSAVNSMGVEMETLRAKSQVVFGDSLGQVTKWADANAAAMGLTSLQATSLATNMADLLKPMGFTAEQAAVMSTEMTDLSGALSAWSGGTIDAAGVSDIMTKAMLGETDGLKQLGISISAADVATRLAEKGQTALTGAALAQAEALAVQELILEKSTDAQTAWADGSMDAVKAANEQKASIQGIKESFVNALYPAIQKVIPLIADATAWIGEKMPIAMAFVKDWVEANWPKIQATIATFVDFFQTNALPIIEKVVGFMVATFNDIKAWVDENWPAIQETIKGVVEAIQVIIEKVTGAITAIWETHGDRILSYITTVWNTIKTVIDAAITIVRGVINTVTSLITGDWSGVWDGIKTVLSGAWEAIKAIVGLAIAAVKLTITLALDGIKLAWETVWRGVAGFIDARWEDIKGFVSGGVNAVVGFVTGIPGRISATVSGLFKGIETGITAAKDWVSEKIDDVVGFATGLKGRMSGIFSGMWDGIKSAFGSVINSVIGVWNGLEFKVPGVSAFGQTIGGFTIGVPDISPVRLHVGGQVGGMSFAGMGNDEVAAILQRGENVLTAGQTSALASSGGNTFNLNVMATPGTNRVELGRELIELIRESERSNGTNWRSSLVPS